jgi:hypothetical protein
VAPSLSCAAEAVPPEGSTISLRKALVIRASLLIDQFVDPLVAKVVLL